MRMQSITTAFLLAEITPDKPDMQDCAAPMTATGKGFVEMYLAAGLPLTSFGRDKKAFQDYLCRGGKPVSFRYEGQDYAVTISKVSLFPQGYAAVLTQNGLLDEPSVIVADIGGWTVDLMRLDNRIPNAATCRSIDNCIK